MMKTLLIILLLIPAVNAAFLPHKIILNNNGSLLLLQNNKKMAKATIKKFKKTFSKLARKRGGVISINDVWWSKTFNAYAMKYGPLWKISVHGALLKHEDMTSSLLALVLCHELGHFLGGAPKFQVIGKRWSSYEGQADYWTGQRCLKTFFAKDNNLKIISEMYIDSLAKDKCDFAYKSKIDRALCYRVTMTGLNMGRLIAKITDKTHPALDTPDPTIVETTYKNHPNFQCRVDTYFQSALCPHTGDISDTDPSQGTCEGQNTAFRPGCWFALDSI